MSLAALSEHDLAHWRSTARRAQGAIETRLFIDGHSVDGYPDQVGVVPPGVAMTPARERRGRWS